MRKEIARMEMEAQRQLDQALAQQKRDLVELAETKMRNEAANMKEMALATIRRIKTNDYATLRSVHN